MSLPFPHPAEAARKLIVGRVQALFNDRAKGEAPVMRSGRALFEPGSPVWRVHGDVTTMMVGGIAALLLQMLHPAALAGIWDFSRFRGDMLGRLRRTARFIALTTYAETDQALAAIARVRAIHDQVRGTLPDGTLYAARDPELLAWVHACEAHCFLLAWLRYGNPAMPLEARENYVRQSGRVARMLGADPVPQSLAELDALIEASRPRLKADARVREVAQLVIRQPGLDPVVRPVRTLLTDAAIGLLPDWAREMHGFRATPVRSKVGEAGVTLMAHTLRWAFAPARRPAGRIELRPARVER